MCTFIYECVGIPQVLRYWRRFNQNLCISLTKKVTRMSFLQRESPFVVCKFSCMKGSDKYVQCASNVFSKCSSTDCTHSLIRFY